MAMENMTSSIVASLTKCGIDPTVRVKGVNVVKPIVFGNVAKCFETKREKDGHTHEWTLYVKPYLNEDYSPFIKKILFRLHSSFENPNRVVTEPPYEVKETGYANFEVCIKIFFNDPVEKPLTIYHNLMVHEPGYVESESTPLIPNSIVRSEFYEEIVFQDPSMLMKSLLDSLKPLTNEDYKHDTDFEAQKKHSAEVLTTARSAVRSEIEKMVEKLKLAKETLLKSGDKLDVAQLNAYRKASGMTKKSGSGPVAGTSKSGPVTGTSKIGPVTGTSKSGPVAGTSKML